MNILGIDTSATACSIGILADQNYITRHHVAPMQQSKIILPMIQSLLSQTNLTMADLDAIAFGCGPGSFTGVRIAASITQGLAFAANLPVIPISSLAILAQTALIHEKWQHCLVTLDARMNELYWAEYQLSPKGLMQLVGEEKIYALTEVDQIKWINQEAYGVGDGWEKLLPLLKQNSHFHPQHINSTIIPHAEALLQLAAEAWQLGQHTNATNALPNYLR